MRPMADTMVGEGEEKTGERPQYGRGDTVRVQQQDS